MTTIRARVVLCPAGPRSRSSARPSPREFPACEASGLWGASRALADRRAHRSDAAPDAAGDGRTLPSAIAPRSTSDFLLASPSAAGGATWRSGARPRVSAGGVRRPGAAPPSRAGGRACALLPSAPCRATRRHRGDAVRAVGAAPDAGGVPRTHEPPRASGRRCRARICSSSSTGPGTSASRRSSRSGSGASAAASWTSSRRLAGRPSARSSSGTRSSPSVSSIRPPSGRWTTSRTSTCCRSSPRMSRPRTLTRLSAGGRRSWRSRIRQLLEAPPDDAPAAEPLSTCSSAPTSGSRCRSCRAGPGPRRAWTWARARSAECAGQFKALAEEIRGWRAEGFTVRLVVDDERQAERLRQMLSEHELEPWPEATLFSPDGLGVLVGRVRRRASSCPRSGWSSCPSTRSSALSAGGSAGRPFQRGAAITRVHRSRAQRPRRPRGPRRSAAITGCGRSRAAGASADFLLLEYAEGGRLYLPVERLDLITKYMGAPDGRRPARPPRRRRVAARQGIGARGAARDGRGAPATVRRPLGGGAPGVSRRHALAGRIRGRVPLRGDAGPDARHRGRQGGHERRAPHGPPGGRRRRLRQDRGGAARGVQGGGRRPPGGRARAHHRARAAALQHLQRALRAVPGSRRAALALSQPQGAEGGGRGARAAAPWTW